MVAIKMNYAQGDSNIQVAAQETYRAIEVYFQNFPEFKPVEFDKTETDTLSTQMFFFQEEYPVKLERYPDHFQIEGKFKPCYTIRARAGFPDVKRPMFVSNVLDEVASEKHIWDILSQHRDKVLNLVAKEHKLEIYSNGEGHILEKNIAQISEDSTSQKMDGVIKNVDDFIYGLGDWYYADPSNGSGSWHVGKPIL